MLSADISRRVAARRLMIPFSFRNVNAIVHLIDVVLVVGASVGAGCAYQFQVGGEHGDLHQIAATGLLVAVLAVGFDAMAGASRPEELLKPHKQLRSVVIAWLFASVIVLGLAFAWKVSLPFSRGMYLTFLLSGMSLMAANRLVCARLLATAQRSERLKPRRTAVLYHAAIPAAQVQREIDALRLHGYLPLWQICWPGDARRPVLDLPSVLRGTDVEEIVVMADWAGAPDLIDNEQFARLPPVPVRFLPIGSARALCSRPREPIGPAVLFELQSGPLSGSERLAKTVFDKAAAAIALLAVAPLFLFCALLIRAESDGPVFFRQARRGFNGQPFDIWKFRTMRVTENGDVVIQATIGDERVTRVGRFLRRASIDELPQLINVLRGEMSIVGPRPHAISHDDHYDQLIADYARRHHMRPGLTGWAQVQGARGQTPTIEHMRRRVELDLWYINNWSFGRDIAIMLSTVRQVLIARDAY